MTETQEQPPSPPRCGKYLTLLTLLIAVIALVMASFQHWHYQSHQANLKSFQEKQESHSELERSIQAKIAELQQQQATLQQTLKSVESKQGSASDWQRAEALYQLRLAALTLQYQGQVAPAIALLEASDHRLSQLTDPKISAVRQLIATKITELRAVPAVDREKILASLAALSQRIPHLPLAVKIKAPQAMTETPPAKNSWRETMNNSVQKIEKLIIIRRRDQAIQPLLSNEQQLILAQNIQLLLQQAQWAVFQRDRAVYQQSLKSAKQWLSNYYEAENSETRALQQGLQELTSIDINPTLPSLSESITQLEESH